MRESGHVLLFAAARRGPDHGVEMASTGEVACMGADVYEAYLYALEGSCVKIPTKKQADAGKTVFLSMHSLARKLRGRGREAGVARLHARWKPGHTAKALRLRGV